jgi:ATP-dependent Clp protease ATP-binding subunit ClpA
MKLLRRSARPRTRSDRAGERYITAGAEEARRLGHSYVGTEHVLLALTRNPHGGATRVLGRLGVTHSDIKNSKCLAQLWAPKIDPDALATLGIDLETVRERVEETFGPRALEQDRAGMLDSTGKGIQCVMPRLKQALENAARRAGETPLRDEHVLLGMLSVADSIAARALAEFGVTLATVEAIENGEAP